MNTALSFSLITNDAYYDDGRMITKKYNTLYLLQLILALPVLILILSLSHPQMIVRQLINITTTLLGTIPKCVQQGSHSLPPKAYNRLQEAITMNVLHTATVLVSSTL